MSDELAEHLDALARDDCYRVDAVLKEGAFETTQRVYFVGANGAEQGPYVRKYIDGDAGLGTAYTRIWNMQRAGRRFLHLPRIIDCYTMGQQRVVVMEHVCGETLSDVVYRCDPSVELAVDVFPRVCEAVQELHEAFDPPIIHRDLKPSNIIVTRDNLTIIDFGIARSFDEQADEDTRHFGTRAYAPPEQFGYGQTDVRSDVYALGMMLYFCLVEKTPDTPARQNAFRSPSIPEAISAVIARAAAFDPRDRYASVSELRQAFLAAAASLAERATLTAVPPMSPEALGSRERRPGGFLSRVPFRLGIAWDVVLVFAFILFAVVTTQMVFYPKPEDLGQGAPLPLRALSYYALLLLMFAPTFYLLCDRRPLRRILPIVRRVSLKHEVIVCVILLVIGFFVVGISAQFF